MAFRDIVAKIKPAVVGLGLLEDGRDPLSVVIIGTGFIVDPGGWIMTNRHVAELFLAERSGSIGVRNALARAVLFVDSTGRTIPHTGRPAVSGFGAAPFPIVEVSFPPAQADGDLHYESVPDLALCKINTEKLHRAGLEQLPFLSLGDSSIVREGDEVGICGFPLGLTLPRDNKMRQMTAIVQRGIVAAVLPWTGIPNPHAFQLDININGGSSGSPMFLADTGEIVGVVFAAPYQPHRISIGVNNSKLHIDTVPLPTGFGYAVPTKRYSERAKPIQALPDVIHKDD
jgi:S1-C subfamily serine protease